MIGQSVAHYEITDRLGAGGMGEVYRATDARLNRQVALKVLPQVFARDTQRMGCFEMTLNWSDELKRLVPTD